LIETGIKKVVVCNLDPNPLVAGKGIAKLKGHGIEVETGILEDEGRILNRFFFKAQEERLPFITLKWAQTADGFIARKDGSSKWISSPLSRLYVHKMRSEHQSILVGKNTLLLDNPKLNVRGWRGKHPIRIVIDPNLELPANLNVLSDGDSSTLIFNSVKDEAIGSNRWIRNQGPFDLSAFLHQLFKEGISSVFVEGGTKLIGSFLNADLWDEAIVFESEIKFGQGLPAPTIENGVLKRTSLMGKDICRIYHKKV
jgi:diaminohydroxyphosphoribosylaminopyrimidine deaminase/5-amino-6-(5-phosphoribosylamino)uracil reductase